MILHRLVEIHALQNRRVEPRQKFRCNNDEFEGVQSIPKTIQQLVLLVTRQLILCIFAFLVIVAIHDDRRSIRRPKERIKFLLVGYTVRAIEYNDLTLHMRRFNLFAIMLYYMLAHLTNAVWRCKKRLCICLVDNIVPLLIGDLVRHLLKFAVESIFINMHFNWRCLELERQSRTIINRVLK